MNASIYSTHASAAIWLYSSVGLEAASDILDDLGRRGCGCWAAPSAYSNAPGQAYYLPTSPPATIIVGHLLMSERPEEVFAALRG